MMVQQRASCSQKVDTNKDDHERSIPMKTKQRSVEFGVAVEFDYQVQELTKKERERLWYTMEEIEKLHDHEWKKLAAKDQPSTEENSSGNRKESDTFSWRGMEHMMKNRGADRDDRVQKICDSTLNKYDALLEAEEEQGHHENVEHDLLSIMVEQDETPDAATKYNKMAEALRESSQALTRKDSELALKHGLKDQLVAEAVQQNQLQTQLQRMKRTKKRGGNNEDSVSSSLASVSSQLTFDSSFQTIITNATDGDWKKKKSQQDWATTNNNMDATNNSTAIC